MEMALYTGGWAWRSGGPAVLRSRMREQKGETRTAACAHLPPSLAPRAFTVTEAASSVFGGAAFDVLGLTVRQTLAVLTTVAGVLTALWAAYALLAGAGWGAAGGSGKATGGARAPSANHV